MKATGKEAKEGGQIFTPVKMNVACLLFVRTRAPVEPVSFVKRICQDAKIPGKQRCRYVNRLIPMTAIGKATEAGLYDVACKVLGETFALKRAEVDPTVELTPEAKAASEAMVQKLNDPLDAIRGGPPAEGPPLGYTFAIRPSIRNNNTLTRDVIIKKVAGLIDSTRHTVNLEKPDKVILIEVYQNSCGISVVDGDYWDDLKKYNLTELYGFAHKQRDEQKNQPQEGEKAQSTEDKAKSTGEETRQAEERI
jgi:tRNA acetyltransferase TAN1